MRHDSSISVGRPQHTGRSSTQSLGWRLWVVVFLTAASLYVLTAQRGVNWQDSGKRQYRVLVGDYTGNLGLALAHPAWIAAGRVMAAVTSDDQLLFLLNAFSGVGMALALANVAGIGGLLTGRWWAGVLAAAMLAAAHTAWWLATIAEVYTWSLAGFTGEIWLLLLLLRRRHWGYLAGLALLAGAGLNVHNFALLALPIYAVIAISLAVRRKIPVWSLPAAAGCWLLGAAPYLAMTVSLAFRTGDVATAITSALTGDYARDVFNVSLSARRMSVNLLLAAMNFLSPLMPLAIVGWARMGRRLGRSQAAALIALTLVHGLFFVRYSVPDQFMFMLPTLALVGIAAAIGLDVAAKLPRRPRNAVIALCAASVLWQPALYLLAVPAARQVAPTHLRTRYPYRNEMRYWLIPWKHDEHSAAHFAEAALAQVETGAVILSGPTAAAPLRVYQQLGRAPERVVVQGVGPLPNPWRETGAFLEAVRGRPVYAEPSVSDRLPQTLKQDVFDRTDGPLIRLR